jgi:hypothetical protein
MSASPSNPVKWKWWALAAMATVLLSLIPQIQLWLVRGRDWNGAYASLQGDEYLYSAYINALIDGRPRRNDPFAGQDNTSKSPLPESTFSIQFVPAYAIYLLARAFGISASAGFIVLTPVAGLLASLSIFWLLVSVTGNGKLAAVGVLLVLCCGALAGEQGMIGVLLNHKRSFFVPFLRRYQPAAAFSLLFVFCTLIWRALNVDSIRSARLHSILAGTTLAVLVFSYLYLWTTAAAWFGCLAVIWLYFRPAAERRRSLELFAIVGAIAIIALIPYVYLVSHRAASSDDLVVLTLTHRPDLLRTPELIGGLILIALIVAMRRGKIEGGESRAILAASFALVPFVVFNQQMLTGRSMQPFHFETFAANYCVLVGLVILAALLWRPLTNRALLGIAVLCLFWGAIEVSLPAFARSMVGAAEDQMIPVLLRLKELSKQDGTFAALRDTGKTSALVFSPQADVMGLLPTWAPQGTLLSAGALDFGSATEKQRKQLLYLHLYFCQVDAARLREFLNDQSTDSYMNFYVPSVIFGADRILPMLTHRSAPIEQHEIEDEVRTYQTFTGSLSRKEILQHPLMYVVTKVEPETDLSHIDLWYERDAGERVGIYNLYRVKLRK